LGAGNAWLIISCWARAFKLACSPVITWRKSVQQTNLSDLISSRSCCQYAWRS